MSLQDYADLVPIGQGQYGVAYKARSRLDGQLYCIKRIPMTAKDDQKSALKEAQLLAQLEHPNIIAYKECFIDTKDEALCIVTSFCEEGDLFNLIRKKSQHNEFFTEDEVMGFFIQIASALHYIHNKKILHRDLKTQNVFIARGGILKMGDFGISKVLEKTGDFASTVTGTPYYMAPEICTNQPYTFKSDIWSLGCVLYELCTLKHAFAADSLLSLVYQIVKGTFPPIPTDMFSQGLSDLVSALLVRDTAQRPTLQQIFQLPYVHYHVQQFRQNESRDVLRKANTMTKRRERMDKIMEEARHRLDKDVQDDLDKLTPKERMARRKEMERKKRELELQLASMTIQRERDKASERKMANIYNSNVGGATGVGGSATLKHLKKGGTWDIDEPTRGRGEIATGGGGYGDTVNLATMPGGGYDHLGDTRPSGGRPGTTLGRTAYQEREDRPIGGRTNGYDGGDTVLLGSVMQAGPLGGSPSRQGVRTSYTGMSTGPSPLRQTGGYGGGGGYGGYDDDDSVNMGTVNLGQGGGMGGRTMSAGGAGTLGGRGGATSSSRGAVGASSPGLGAAPVLPPNIINGFKFGITNPNGMTQQMSAAGSPARLGTPGQPPPPTPPTGAVRFGARSESKPRGSFDFAAAAAAPPPARGGSHTPDGDSEYEYDFEDYDEDADVEVVNQRIKIINQVDEMENSLNGTFGEHTISAVQEKITSTTKNQQAQALRARCQNALGSNFGDVYAYLRRVRGGGQSDEREVQKRLLELCGGDRAQLPGCFLVDQLVFQEMMYK